MGTKSYNNELFNLSDWMKAIITSTSHTTKYIYNGHYQMTSLALLHKTSHSRVILGIVYKTLNLQCIIHMHLKGKHEYNSFQRKRSASSLVVSNTLISPSESLYQAQ